MTPSERERRIEAGMRAWLPLGSPLLGRRVVACILDAADEAVPVVSEAEATELWESLRKTGEQRDRAEAAARDFARAMEGVARNLDRKTSAAPYGVRRLYTGDRDALRSALTRHPSFSGEEGTEG